MRLGLVISITERLFVDVPSTHPLRMIGFPVLTSIAFSLSRYIKGELNGQGRQSWFLPDYAVDKRIEADMVSVRLYK